MKEGDKESNFKGYVVIPKGLTIEQREVFVYLYEKCNFQDMTVDYTVSQIVADVDKRLNLTTKKVRTILKNLLRDGYITDVCKGSKGKPSIIKIGAIKGQLMGNYKANKMAQPSHLKEIKGNKGATNGQLMGNPIKEKEKESIYSHWNSKKIIVHKKMTSEIVKAIDKALRSYSVNEIIHAIDVYSEILQSDYYFNYKWGLKDFLNRNNGISTFMEDGSNNVNYKEWKEKNKPKNSKIIDMF